MRRWLDSRVYPLDGVDGPPRAESAPLATSRPAWEAPGRLDENMTWFKEVLHGNSVEAGEANQPGHQNAGFVVQVPKRQGIAPPQVFPTSFDVLAFVHRVEAGQPEEIIVASSRPAADGMCSSVRVDILRLAGVGRQDPTLASVTFLQHTQQNVTNASISSKYLLTAGSLGVVYRWNLDELRQLHRPGAATKSDAEGKTRISPVVLDLHSPSCRVYDHAAVLRTDEQDRTVSPIRVLDLRDRRFASGDSRGGIVVWDLGVRRETAKTVLAHFLIDRMHCLCLSPPSTGSRYLYAGSTDGSIHVFDVDQQQHSGVWVGSSLKNPNEPCAHEAAGGVRCICTSPGGELVFSGGEDRCVRVWDSVSGEERHKIKLPKIPSLATSLRVTTLCSVHEGSRLLVGFRAEGHGSSQQGYVLLYDVDTLSRVGDLSGRDVVDAGEIRCIDGWWDVNNSGSALSHPEPIRSVELCRPSHDGKLLLTYHNPFFLNNLAGAASDGGVGSGRSVHRNQHGQQQRAWHHKAIVIWDIDSTRESMWLEALSGGLLQDEKNDFKALCTSSDGSTVTCGTKDGKIQVFNVSTGKLHSGWKWSTGSEIKSMCYLEAGDTEIIFSSSKTSPEKPFKIHLWNLRATSGNRNDGIGGTCVAGELGFLSSAADDSAGRTRFGTVNGLCLDNTQCWMFGASQSGEIYVWDVSAASNIDGTHDDEAMRDLTATISKDSVGLRLQRHSMVESGDSSTTGSLKHIRQDSPAICICASPKDKNLVVSGHKDGRIALWRKSASASWRDGNLLPEPRLRGAMHRRKVNAVTISRAGTRIVSGSDDGSIRVWDVEGCGLVACIVNGRNTVQGLCISGDGQRVVAASQSWNSGTTLRVWDIATRSRVADLKGEQRAVWAVALVAGERRVVAACKFGFLRVYDLDHYMCLSPATSTCAPAEIIGNESVQVLPSRGPQSESSTVQEAYAWGLQFRLRHRPTDLPGVDSATSPGFTTLHVRSSNDTQSYAHTTFFLPVMFQANHKVILSRAIRVRRDIDVLVTVVDRDDDTSARPFHRSWLSELPRGRRAQHLRTFMLPPMHHDVAMLAIDGVGATKSFLHALAAEPNTVHRAHMLQSCGGSLVILLRMHPELQGLLAVTDTQGRIPLDAFLATEEPDSPFFADLMIAYSRYAAVLRQETDIAGLMAIMDHIAQAMPRMLDLNLDMSPVWNMLTLYGVIKVRSDVECRSACLLQRMPFLDTLASPEELTAAGVAKAGESGARLWLASTYLRRRRRRREGGGHGFHLLLVTIPHLFEPFHNSSGVLKEEPRDFKSPWELLVCCLKLKRFSMPLARVAVDYRHTTGGLSLIPYFIVADAVVITSYLALLYIGKERGIEGGSPHLGEWVTLSCLALATLVLIVPEFNQIRVSGILTYVADVLNLMDLLLVVSAILNFSAVVAGRPQWFDPVLAVGIILSWVKFISFMRTSRESAGIIRMIIQVAKQTGAYLILLVLLMAGFCFANHALLPNSPSSEIYKIAIQQFRFMFADFGVFDYNEAKEAAIMEGRSEDDAMLLHGSYLEDEESFGVVANYTVFLVINVVYIYLVGIIVFNLLISVISEIYEEVKESEVSAVTGYRARLDMELFGIKKFIADVRNYCRIWPSDGERGSTLYMWVDVMDSSWQTGEDSQGLRPMFRRIEDVKKTLERKLDDEVLGVRQDISRLDSEVKLVRAEFQLQMTELRYLRQHLQDEFRLLHSEIKLSRATDPRSPQPGVNWRSG